MKIWWAPCNTEIFSTKYGKNIIEVGSPASDPAAELEDTSFIASMSSSSVKRTSLMSLLWGSVSGNSSWGSFFSCFGWLNTEEYWSDRISAIILTLDTSDFEEFIRGPMPTLILDSDLA